MLITGENGTGKGMVAQALHAVSPRAPQPLVTVNAGGLSEGVFESELFGHVKGAFTDAKADRVGRFELADGGTLFLDEIANISLEPAGQAAARARDRRVRARRLLAHAPRRRAHPLGHQRRPPRRRSRRAASARTCSSASTRSRSTCRRCATAARTSRCSPGTSSQQHAQRYRKRLTGFDAAAMQLLLAHPWPGNVRELDHAVERAVLMAQADAIGAARPRPARQPRGGAARSRT